MICSAFMKRPACRFTTQAGASRVALGGPCFALSAIKVKCIVGYLAGGPHIRADAHLPKWEDRVHLRAPAPTSLTVLHSRKRMDGMFHYSGEDTIANIVSAQAALP